MDQSDGAEAASPKYPAIEILSEFKGENVVTGDKVMNKCEYKALKIILIKPLNLSISLSYSFDLNHQSYYYSR